MPEKMPYQPSEEEMKKAEETMSFGQVMQSVEREGLFKENKVIFPEGQNQERGIIINDNDTIIKFQSKRGTIYDHSDLGVKVSPEGAMQELDLAEKVIDQEKDRLQQEIDSLQIKIHNLQIEKDNVGHMKERVLTIKAKEIKQGKKEN